MRSEVQFLNPYILINKFKKKKWDLKPLSFDHDCKQDFTTSQEIIILQTQNSSKHIDILLYKTERLHQESVDKDIHP